MKTTIDLALVNDTVLATYEFLLESLTDKNAAQVQALAQQWAALRAAANAGKQAGN